jgi:hypothetical protein
MMMKTISFFFPQYSESRDILRPHGSFTFPLSLSFVAFPSSDSIACAVVLCFFVIAIQRPSNNDTRALLATKEYFSLSCRIVDNITIVIPSY